MHQTDTGNTVAKPKKAKTPTDFNLPADDFAFVRREVGQAVAGIGSSAAHAWALQGKFPKPVRLSYRCSRYRAGDLRLWLSDPKGWRPELALDTPKS